LHAEVRIEPQFRPKEFYSLVVPLCVGLPFAKGTSSAVLEDLVVSSGTHVLPQSSLTPIGNWADGSIRWACVDIVLDAAKIQSLQLVSRVDKPQESYPKSDFVTLEPRFHQGRLSIDLPIDESSFSSKLLDVSVVVSGTWGRSILKFDTVALGDNSRNELAVDFNALASLKIESLALPMEFQISGRCWCTGQIDVSLRVCNPNAADHPGGNWDLGNAGSVYLSDISLILELVSAAGTGKLLVRETLTSMVQTAEESIELFQASSGGMNWNSPNHIDRHRKIPMPFRGYRLDIDHDESTADRATPYVAIQCDGVTLGVACKRFWQNFPMAIRASARRIEVGLMPKEAGYEHELQGGEQKTFQFAAYFGSAPADTFPLDGYLSDPYRVIDPKYLEFTGALSEGSMGLIDDQAGQLYESLVNQAIEGSDSFFAKREKIDEYGWRNYGDLYGDHEAVYHKGPTPMISHYNNQYDCVLGFFYQFMRSGDPRWYEQMIAMADHAWDIDTYHTQSDKLLYNGGLFWHTYHYADADTGTHRSYPRSLLLENHFESGKDLKAMGKTGEKLKKVYGKGGGPAASQNYSTGWMYAYYLTGETRYKKAAVNAADYVIRIEDGSKTPFRWLSLGQTGHATCSSHDYYGPGRASANSTLALLTGYELTGDRKYIDMAVSLMKRTVHPGEDIQKRDLLNAELRWFYTMYLQALCRLVEVLKDQDSYREDFFYAVASLMHYARWMLGNERPILDTPEKLQYPTETWAAQDIRKWHVLAYAAKWASSSKEQIELMERAEFFFNHSLNTLETFPTKSLCRPVVLLMNYGWQREKLKNTPLVGNPVPEHQRFEKFRSFTPQKTIAVKRAKKVILGAVVALSAMLVAGIAYLLR
jgi:hypothetical protein